MRSRPRPGIVTLMSLGVLTLAVAFLSRLTAGLRSHSLPLTIPAWYLPLTGAIWGVGGVLLAWGMFTGKRWAPALTRLSAVTFTLWYWADRLLLTRSDYAAMTRPADAAISLTALMVLLWGLNRRGTREYFGE